MLVFIIFCAIGIALYGLHKHSHEIKELKNQRNQSKVTNLKEAEYLSPKNQKKDYFDQGINWIVNKINKK